ncbi:MAG: histidine phosphatase family protein [Deltaproteobacteria bacterium]|nr:histidine phosphatase family protein [Deltaproteobacteria bacterium]MBW2420974.1 histidine phosphatase family protein [Deltaproteobacteria bacterium]
MFAFSRIIVVRHGETEGQSSIRYHGITDVPLSDEGREQIRHLASTLPAEGYDVVVSSPLRRALETAEIIAPSSPVRVEPAFREIDFGRWEGLTAEEIEARDPELFREWRTRGTEFDFPEGEPRAAFRARVREGIDALVADGAHEGDSALIAAHKGVFRTIVERLTRESIDDVSYPPLGSAALLVRSDGRWRVEREG